jgi:T4-like virus tail tube protein gp19
MAVARDTPYAQFNFLVDLGTGNTDGPQAGFQECSAIGMHLEVIEYRNGNDRSNEVRKLTGLARADDVTLRRGIIGSLDLQSEDHSQAVQSWKLLRARIVKHTSGPLNAKGNGIAIEELTLAYERLELE